MRQSRREQEAEAEGQRWEGGKRWETGTKTGTRWKEPITIAS
jgi:hypothetical protein